MVQARAFSFPILQNYRTAANGLFKSMARLSTGSRINRPGDAPTDYAISENLRLQIHNTEIAIRNTENMNSLIQTSDNWLQVGNDILKRMAELATGAIDGSKSDGDRKTMNLEYLQLKKELSRLSLEAKYNTVPIAGRDQILSYDLDKETFLFSELDGGETYHLPVKIQSGLNSINNQDFLYDTTKSFGLSSQGRSIYYVDRNDHLVRYDIEEGTLKRDSTDSESKGFDVDEKGRLWYATETATGSGVFSLRQQNLDTWSQDTSLIDNSSIVDMASTEFSVYNDRVYYRQDSSNNIVSRSLLNINDVRVEMSSTEFTLNTASGQFAISEQGQYVIDVPSSGTVRMINLKTRLADTFATGSSSIEDLSISVDSNRIVFNDTTEKAIYTLDVEEGDQPNITNIQKTHLASGTDGFKGLNLDGSSHRGNFRIHNGPNASQSAFVQGADMRLYALGVTHTNVQGITDAKEALRAITQAREIVNMQRAVLGAAGSRFSFTLESLGSYGDNISMADSRIRDVDMPLEVSEMTREKVRYEATNSLITQANRLKQVVLKLMAG